jgi:hypothetical protein
MSKFKQAVSVSNDGRDDDGYASMGCGHLGCINIGTISHGTDGKSPFYCRIHYKQRGQTFGEVNQEVGQSALEKIYAELNKRRKA